MTSWLNKPGVRCDPAAAESLSARAQEETGFNTSLKQTSLLNLRESSEGVERSPLAPGSVACVWFVLLLSVQASWISPKFL